MARLDALCDVAPASVGDALALHAAVLARTEQATATAIVSLLAARVGAAAVAEPVPSLAAWMQFVSAEERRARTGAPLTVERLVAEDLLGAPESTALVTAPLTARGPGLHAQLADALASTVPRPVLLRAATVAAALGARSALARIAPALMLVSAGLTSRVRLLPFAGLADASAVELLTAWDAGDPDPFTEAALSEAAAAARATRLAVRAAIAATARDQDALAPLGRAGIGARAALSQLRTGLATTAPALSAALDCSRPAAGDALERLVEVGLAREVTGRQRDRVFVDALAWEVTAA